MNSLAHLHTLAIIDGDIIPIIAISIGGAVAIVGIIFGCIKSVLRTRSIEQTKREVAAYVAEGSISPDDAFKILNTGKSPDGSCGA